MEKNAGIFALIPEFIQFKTSLNKAPVPEEPVIKNEIRISKLYEDDIVFMFYSKSADNTLPGKGVGETIPQNLVKNFSSLLLYHNGVRNYQICGFNRLH